MIRRLPELPPEVERHVRAQLVATDWERLLSDMRTLCADCPAEGDPDICVSCPLEGIATAAATLTLQARVTRLQAKGVKRNGQRKI